MKTVDQQDEHFHTVIKIIFVLGRGDKQQLYTHASSKHLSPGLWPTGFGIPSLADSYWLVLLLLDVRA